MKLITHLQQGKLLFFRDLGYRLTVEENQHFRWMSFNDLPQSVMHLRQPSWLTLPHHFYLILPLALIKPKNITEFGLGGGNLSRYLCSILPNAVITSFEAEFAVINCFNQFFNRQPFVNHQVIHLNSTTDIITNAQSAHWLIYDIFSPEVHNGINMNSVKQLLTKLPDTAWFTLNLPNLKADKLNLVLRSLQKQVGQKRMYYFFVPHYKNIIVHIGPESNITNEFALPSHTFKRLQKLWQHACLDRQLKSNWAVI